MPYASGTSFAAPSNSPSALIFRTSCSISFISVSSSHGLISRMTFDLAIRAGFFDFFAAYSAKRFSRNSAAALSSSSSSEPNRSTSSSSSSASAFLAGAAGLDAAGLAGAAGLPLPDSSDLTRSCRSMTRLFSPSIIERSFSFSFSTEDKRSSNSAPGLAAKAAIPSIRSREFLMCCLAFEISDAKVH
uniref:Uncharacterized protein n=2 Tax=Anopheles christyi TaxID=43041 RepID=A0A182KHQ0_9DIPT